MGAARLLAADFASSFMWVWSGALIKALVFRVMGLGHGPAGEAAKAILSVVNMFAFAFVGKATGGGAYNPLTVLSSAIAGGFPQFLFAVGARIPAQKSNLNSRRRGSWVEVQDLGPVPSSRKKGIGEPGSLTNTNGIEKKRTVLSVYFCGFCLQRRPLRSRLDHTSSKESRRQTKARKPASFRKKERFHSNPLVNATYKEIKACCLVDCLVPVFENISCI